MTAWMERLKQYQSDRKKYFKNGRNEIEQRNFNILRITSFVMALFVVVFIFITPLFLPGWSRTVFHTLLFIDVLVFGIISELLIRFCSKKLSNRLIEILIAAFIWTVMALLVCLDTIVYPFAAQVFVVIFLVVAPILFIVPLFEMLISQIAFLIFFLTMVMSYKTPDIASGDAFSAVLGCMIGIAVYFVVTRIRVHDYSQRIAYKISSEIDNLTEIENRATCKKKIDQYLAMKDETSGCAMIVLDVDCFKQINDKLGHSMGDKVLYGVAQNLKMVFRRGDIIGRFGGDEFIAFMKDLHDDSVIENKCTELNKRVAEILEGKFGITCSMGVCYLKRGNATLEEMFHVADSALYEAKTFHKGNYVQHEFHRAKKLRNDLPKMVIIDDNSVDRETIAVQFEENFQIEKFDTGIIALDYIKKCSKEINIILLDMIMPDMSGNEVLAELKANTKTAWIPVVAISADESMEEKALKCGADDMIVKPIVPAIVKLRIDRLMKK